MVKKVVRSAIGYAKETTQTDHQASYTHTMIEYSDI